MLPFRFRAAGPAAGHAARGRAHPRAHELACADEWARAGGAANGQRGAKVPGGTTRHTGRPATVRVTTAPAMSGCPWPWRVRWGNVWMDQLQVEKNHSAFVLAARNGPVVWHMAVLPATNMYRMFCPRVCTACSPEPEVGVTDPARGVRRAPLPAGYGSGFETSSVPLAQFLRATFGTGAGVGLAGVVGGTGGLGASLVPLESSPYYRWVVGVVGRGGWECGWGNV